MIRIDTIIHTMKRARPLAEIEAEEKAAEEELRTRRRAMFTLRMERSRNEEYKRLKDLRVLDLPEGALAFFTRMAKHMSTDDGESLATNLRFWREEHAARRVQAAVKAVSPAQPSQPIQHDMHRVMRASDQSSDDES